MSKFDKRALRYAGQPPTAYCAHHGRYINDYYIRKRSCAMRMCRHLQWLPCDIHDAFQEDKK